MSVIANLVARFSADSREFEGATNRVRQSLRGMMQESNSLQRAQLSLTQTMAQWGRVTGGIYAVQRALTPLVKAALDSDKAVSDLRSTLAVTGEASGSNIAALRDQAKALQQVTIYGDEAILSAMSYAKAMGTQTDQLGDLTKAAIGLAAMYHKDLPQAVRLLALAQKGETGQLKEMGIVLDATRSKHGQYLELLDKGRQGFGIATEEAKSLTGQLAQLKNGWQDLKANMGGIIAGPLGGAAVLRQTNQDLKNIQELFHRWRSGIKLGAAPLDVHIPSAVPAAAPPPAEAAATVTGITEAQRDARAEVAKLTQDLTKQWRATQNVTQAQKDETEAQIYANLVGRAYQGNQVEQTRLLSFRAEMIERTRRAMAQQAADDYVARLGEETAVLRILARGHNDEARALEVINDLKRQGIGLDSEQQAALEAQIAQTRRAQEPLRKMADLQQQQRQVFDGIADGIGDLTSRWLVYGDDVGAMSRQLAQQMIADIIRIRTTMMALQIGSAIFGGGGQTPGLGQPGVTGVHVPHSGGIPGRDPLPTRFVSPGLFSHAERAHTGIGPGERPVIIRNEEGVFTPGQMRALGRGMGGGRAEALLEEIAALLRERQTVKLDAKVVAPGNLVTREQMEGTQGEAWTMYHVGRNKR